MEFFSYLSDDEVRYVHEASLEIGSNDASQPSVSVALSCEGVGPTIEIIKNQLRFGHVVAGTSQTEALVVFNRGERPLIISNIKINHFQYRNAAN